MDGKMSEGCGDEIKVQTHCSGTVHAGPLVARAKAPGCTQPEAGPDCSQ